MANANEPQGAGTKFDLNIICCEEQGNEPEKITALREFLTHFCNMRVYGPADHMIGSSIFDAVTHGLRRSRFTLIWVTQADVQGNRLQRFFRQNALYSALDTNGRGSDHIIPVLSGVPVNTFQETNQAFQQYVCLSVDDEPDWRGRIRGRIQPRDMEPRQNDGSRNNPGGADAPDGPENPQAGDDGSDRNHEGADAPDRPQNPQAEDDGSDRNHEGADAADGPQNPQAEDDGSDRNHEGADAADGPQNPQAESPDGTSWFGYVWKAVQVPVTDLLEMLFPRI